MCESGVMEDYTCLWYDVRPHPELGTVEVRVVRLADARRAHAGAGRAGPGDGQGAGRALRRRRRARRLSVADARREQVAGRPPRPRRRARRPALPASGSRTRRWPSGCCDRLREHAQDLGSAADLEAIDDLLDAGNGAAAPGRRLRGQPRPARGHGRDRVAADGAGRRLKPDRAVGEPSGQPAAFGSSPSLWPRRRVSGAKKRLEPAPGGAAAAALLLGSGRQCG